jgi:hypothetical protein
VAQDKSIKTHEAILDKRGLPFFVIALGLFWVSVCAWAESSLSVSCAIPEVAGLNTPTVEEETIETAQKDQPQLPAAQAEAVVKKTLYSR